MRLTNCFWAVAFCLTISGCSTTDVIMKKQMETDSRLEQLVQGNAAANARLEALANEVKELRKQANANSAELQELKPAFREMKSALEAKPPKKDTEGALGSVSRIEVVNKEPAAGDKDSGVQNAYMQAFGLYSANNYPGAVEAFEAFIKTYPKSEYAGNAQYWIGECYYSQHDYPLALVAFNKLLATYPRGSKVPDAMLKIGYTYINMNEPAKTKRALQLLVDKFPNSQAAMKAKERLNRN
jgi:tol-pal system protein YbgF